MTRPPRKVTVPDYVRGFDFDADQMQVWWLGYRKAARATTGGEFRCYRCGSDRWIWDLAAMDPAGMTCTRCASEPAT